MFSSETTRHLQRHGRCMRWGQNGLDPREPRWEIQGRGPGSPANRPGLQETSSVLAEGVLGPEVALFLAERLRTTGHAVLSLWPWPFLLVSPQT